MIVCFRSIEHVFIEDERTHGISLEVSSYRHIRFSLMHLAMIGLYLLHPNRCEWCTTREEEVCASASVAGTIIKR